MKTFFLWWTDAIPTLKLSIFFSALLQLNKGAEQQRCRQVRFPSPKCVGQCKPEKEVASSVLRSSRAKDGNTFNNKSSVYYI